MRSGWRARLARAVGLSVERRPTRRGDGLEDLRRDDAPLQSRGDAGPLRHPAGARRAPAEPREAWCRLARPRLQHGGELRHEHELAELHRRDDHELSHADGRPHGPELRVGGGGHGRAGGAHPGIRAPIRRDDRQFLGRSHAHHAVHPLAALLRLRAGPRLAGRRADLRPVREGHRRAAHELRRADHRHGWQARARREGPAKDQEVDADRAAHRRGAGRLPDRHQAARDQRRRLLQRQLRPPVREPDAALELPRVAGDPADPCRALLHLRRHGAGHSPGLDRPGGHDRDLRRTSCRVRGGRTAG